MSPEGRGVSITIKPNHTEIKSNLAKLNKLANILYIHPIYQHWVTVADSTEKGCYKQAPGFKASFI